jgi:hypothetical protein
MGHRPRSDRRGLRRAVAASVGLHLAIALAVVVAVRSRSEVKQPHGIDTRADDVAIKMSADERAIPIAFEPTKPPPKPPTKPPVEPPAAPQPEPARTPHATAVPTALSADVLNVIRRPTATALRPPSPMADPNVKPAVATLAAPIHGAMKAGQSVVYVLDCSGSMGEFGKLLVARAALVATLHRQPAEVRFQVVAYNTTARALLPGALVPASAANLAAADAEVAKLSSVGRSNHAEAVRLAASLRPDAIVLLTDADELSAASFKVALAAAGAGKAVPVWVAKVTGEGVAAPRELK